MLGEVKDGRGLRRLAVTLHLSSILAALKEHDMTRFAVLSLILVFSFPLLAQRRNNSTPPAANTSAAPTNTAAEADQVKQTDADWAKACAAHDINQFMSFVDPNARFWQGGEGVHGAAIREEFRVSFGDKNFSLKWTPVDATVAASGDLAYSTGTYTLDATGPNGQPIHRAGTYLTVWKKDKDGNWKVIEDIGSAKPPAPTPPTPTTNEQQP
jgi:ketosteroid isomerase-like protein